MGRIYFEETQAMRDTPWIIILIFALSVASILPLANGIYWQVFNGEPWGDKPMSNEGLIILLIVMLSISALIISLFLKMKLEIKIDSEGLQYKFAPLKNKWRNIEKADISSYELKKAFERFTFNRGSRHSRKIGYHYSPLTKTRSMRISGTKHLFLQLKSGENLVIGTQKPEEMERALQKLFSQNAIY